MSPETLQSRYFARLHLSPSALDPTPTLSKLSALCLAHLSHIPFGNLAQHGAGAAPALDIPSIASKVLDRRREGFCFELNLLFGALLASLGYRVTRVAASVCFGTAFAPPHTHAVLVVSAGARRWLVDVGFGEPALAPLAYEVGTEQTTGEGMESRLVEDGGGHVVLEWHVGGAWRARMRWAAALEDGGDFQANLETVLGEDFICARKFIVCKISAKEKVTLAGNVLKITGPPRFGDVVPHVVRTLEDVDEVRQVLEEVFGIPRAETEGLSLEKSMAAPPGMWLASEF